MKYELVHVLYSTKLSALLQVEDVEVIGASDGVPFTVGSTGRGNAEETNIQAALPTQW